MRSALEGALTAIELCLGSKISGADSSAEAHFKSSTSELAAAISFVGHWLGSVIFGADSGSESRCGSSVFAGAACCRAAKGGKADAVVGVKVEAGVSVCLFHGVIRRKLEYSTTVNFHTLLLSSSFRRWPLS